MRTLKSLIYPFQVFLLLFGAYSVANTIDDRSPDGTAAGIVLALVPAGIYAALGERRRTRVAWFGIGLGVMVAGGLALWALGWHLE